MNPDQKLDIAQLVLQSCGDEGYHLVGSLALHAQGVEGAREPDDIDLFTDRTIDGEGARARVCDALRENGFEVEVLRTWATHPFVPGAQCGDLRVTDSEQNSVTLQMVRMPRYFESQNVDGMPVAAPGDLLYSKLEAPENRIAAKDYLDLVALHEHLGESAVDSYVDTYITEIARIRQVPQAEFAGEVYLRLSQVADVPDQAFAAYGVDADAAAQTRASVLAWADRIAPDATQRLDPALAAGLDGLSVEAAATSLTRQLQVGGVSGLTDLQLHTRQAQAERQKSEQLAPLTEEQQRRTALTERQRAEEAVVRRGLPQVTVDPEAAAAARLASAAYQVSTPARGRRGPAAPDRSQQGSAPQQALPTQRPGRDGGVGR